MDIVVIVVGWIISAFGVGSIVSAHINKRIESSAEAERAGDQAECGRKRCAGTSSFRDHTNVQQILRTWQIFDI